MPCGPKPEQYIPERRLRVPAIRLATKSQYSLGRNWYRHRIALLPTDAEDDQYIGSRPRVRRNPYIDLIQPHKAWGCAGELHFCRNAVNRDQSTRNRLISNRG